MRLDGTRLIRPWEAAQRIGVSRQSLSRAMNRGRLKFVEVAGIRLIDRRTLTAYAKVKDQKPGRPRKRRRVRKQ